MDKNFSHWVFPKAHSLETTKEESLEDRMSRIGRAACEKLNPAPSGAPYAALASAPMYWTYKTYPGFVILIKDGDYFKVSYEEDPESHDIKFGTIVPVEMEWKEKL